MPEISEGERLVDYLLSLRLRKKYCTRKGAIELAANILAIISNPTPDTKPKEGWCECDRSKDMKGIYFFAYNTKPDMSGDSICIKCNKMIKPTPPAKKIEPCGICGAEQVLIRGKHPHEDKRTVCPTCCQERLDQISNISDRDYGKCYTAK
jgi:hypothetical protein